MNYKYPDKHKLVNNIRLYGIFILLAKLSFVNGQLAYFTMPDRVCVGENINISNQSNGAGTYYWNFCSGNLAYDPGGINIGNLGQLNGPVYSSIARDGNTYYVFITNIYDGTFTRLNFGNSLTNTPVAENLGTLGLPKLYLEGIQVIKETSTGNWYALVAGGPDNCMIRLSFGSSLANTPIAENLGNIGKKLKFPHSLFIFISDGTYHCFVGNSDDNTILRLDFGNSISNEPTATKITSQYIFSDPVGFYPVLDAENWYMFVANRNDNTIIRLDFGISLLNSPTVFDLGNPGNTLNTPRSISIIRDCGNITGYVVNELDDNLVRLSFPSGIKSKPSGVSLGNMAGFDFPHHISELFRVGDALYAFVTNVNNNTLSRLSFSNCNQSSIISSTDENPPPFSYSQTGTYNVNLLINEGLPSQMTYCKPIEVVGGQIPEFICDSVACLGDTIQLVAQDVGGAVFSWEKPNGSVVEGRELTIEGVVNSDSGVYQLTLHRCTSNNATLNLTVKAPPPFNLGENQIICRNTLTLDAGSGFDSYLWNTGETTQVITVDLAGDYSVKVTTENCTVSDGISVLNCDSKPYIPNAFTPDGDGKNDHFFPLIASEVASYYFFVYDRWGKLLFESEVANEGWDGTYKGNPCPVGLYFYCLKYSAESEPGIYKNIESRGGVTLVR